MSTTFSLVYDDLRNICGLVFSDRDELNNPYFIEDDADVMFDNAWTISISSAENTNRLIGCKASVRRDFTLTLVNRYFSPSRDIAARIEAEKKLVNAQLDFIKYVESNPTTEHIVNVEYSGDNGIEFLEGDRFGFLILQSTIRVEYLETL